MYPDSRVYNYLLQNLEPVPRFGDLGFVGGLDVMYECEDEPG